MTNWNAFQLRMYDARFGRWLSPDPYGQFASPYSGMGNNPVNGVDPDGGFTEPITVLEGVTITASRLSSISWGSVAAGLGSSLLSNAITSSFKPLDDVHYNTNTGKTTVVKTNDNYDEMYVDGKRTGYSSREAWKTYAPDAQVFDGYTSAFYSAAYGSLLRDGNVFARLHRNAPSTGVRSALMKATVQNRDATALYATLAIPAAIIAGGELLGAAAVSEIGSGIINVTQGGTRIIGLEKRIMYIRRATESAAKGNRYLRSIKYWSKTGGKRGLGGWRHWIDW